MGMNDSFSSEPALSRFLCVFDIGGVVIGLDRPARDALLGGSHNALPEATSRLSELNAQFRLGQITEKAYVEQARAIHAVSAETLYQAEDAFLVAGDASMMKLVVDLGKSHRTIAFSNTHVIHWRRVARDLLAADAFHAFYLSHELGLEKPDLISYQAVAEREGYSPENIIFVDDTLANVEAARAAGWRHCIHHRSPAETIAQIATILA
jgi:putative hydrolase of the HAD superfamily